jgi:hypothetical protein
MGSSGVDPGQSLVSIETCPSPIGDVLVMDLKSCNCLELSSSSIFDIHRIIDGAVWGGATESTLMRPTDGLLELAGSFDRTAPKFLYNR